MLTPTQIMIMHFVCHFALNNKICGLQKNQDANTYNFPNTIKLLTKSFSRNIIPKFASTPVYQIILNQNCLRLHPLQYKKISKHNVTHRLRIFPFRQKFMFLSHFQKPSHNLQNL